MQCGSRLLNLPPFLEQRLCDDSLQPTLLSVCAGYEGGTWRCTQLAQYLLVDCLLDFVLAHGAKSAVNSVTAGRQLVEAATVVYQTDKYGKRGEFGELLLHVVIRQFYGTVPAISKLYIKTAANDTVKGFDAVHVAEREGVLDLWLGEAKFYTKAEDAIAAVVPEIAAHIGADYLRNEFLIINNNLDPEWQHYEMLKKMIAPQISLDQVFDRIHLPVLITYESSVIAANNMVSGEFLRSLGEEVRVHWKAFSEKVLPKNIVIHLILMPLGSKTDLVNSLDQKLKAIQGL